MLSLMGPIGLQELIIIVGMFLCPLAVVVPCVLIALRLDRRNRMITSRRYLEYLEEIDQGESRG